jgi:peroxiredoxin
MTANWPYPAPDDDGAARHLKPGLAAPDILLPATVGDPVSLARLDGGNVIFLYPWTGRPGLPNPPNWDDIAGAHGSTPEAEGFRDLHERLRMSGYGVLGVSGQTTEDQKEFAERLRIPFPLLSDAEGRLRKALSLPVFETGGSVYLKRLTLVLRDGKIERTIYPVHPPHTHAADLLATLSERP